jgi:hypothetical protein
LALIFGGLVRISPADVFLSFCAKAAHNHRTLSGLYDGWFIYQGLKRSALPWCLHELRAFNLDAAVGQRRREIAKAGNKAMLAISESTERRKEGFAFSRNEC